MSSLDPPIHRRLIPWITGALYALVTLIAAYYVFELRDSQRAQVVEQLETTVQDQVTIWEDELLTTLGKWMDQALAESDQAALHQTRMRQFEPWFNGLYIWAPQSPSPGFRHPFAPLGDVRFVFPRPPVEESTQGLTSRICIAVAHRLRSDEALTPLQKAAAYVECSAKDRTLWGVGIDENIVTASIKAVTSAVNRAYRDA